jgi:hypothetical protein
MTYSNIPTHQFSFMTYSNIPTHQFSFMTFSNIPTHQFSFMTFSCIKIIHLCEVKQGEVNHCWEKFIVKAKL